MKLGLLIVQTWLVVERLTFGDDSKPPPLVVRTFRTITSWNRNFQNEDGQTSRKHSPFSVICICQSVKIRRAHSLRFFDGMPSYTHCEESVIIWEGSNGLGIPNFVFNKNIKSKTSKNAAKFQKRLLNSTVKKWLHNLSRGRIHEHCKHIGHYSGKVKNNRLSYENRSKSALRNYEIKAHIALSEFLRKHKDRIERKDPFIITKHAMAYQIPHRYNGFNINGEKKLMKIFFGIDLSVHHALKLYEKTRYDKIRVLITRNNRLERNEYQKHRLYRTIRAPKSKKKPNTLESYIDYDFMAPFLPYNTTPDETFAGKWMKMKGTLLHMKKTMLIKQFEYSKIEKRVQKLLEEGEKLTHDTAVRAKMADLDDAARKVEEKDMARKRKDYERKVESEMDKRMEVENSLYSEDMPNRLNSIQKDLNSERAKIFGEQNLEDYLRDGLKSPNISTNREMDKRRKNKGDGEANILVLDGISDIAIDRTRVRDSLFQEDRDLERVNSMLDKILHRVQRDIVTVTSDLKTKERQNGDNEVKHLFGNKIETVNNATTKNNGSEKANKYNYLNDLNKESRHTKSEVKLLNNKFLNVTTTSKSFPKKINTERSKQNVVLNIDDGPKIADKAKNDRTNSSYLNIEKYKMNRIKKASRHKVFENWILYHFDEKSKKKNNSTIFENEDASLSRNKRFVLSNVGGELHDTIQGNYNGQRQDWRSLGNEDLEEIHGDKPLSLNIGRDGNGDKEEFTKLGVEGVGDGEGGYGVKTKTKGPIKLSIEDETIKGSDVKHNMSHLFGVNRNRDVKGYVGEVEDTDLNLRRNSDNAKDEVVTQDIELLGGREHYTSSRRPGNDNNNNTTQRDWYLYKKWFKKMKKVVADVSKKKAVERDRTLGNKINKSLKDAKKDLFKLKTFYHKRFMKRYGDGPRREKENKKTFKRVMNELAADIEEVTTYLVERMEEADPIDVMEKEAEMDYYGIPKNKLRKWEQRNREETKRIKLKIQGLLKKNMRIPLS